DYTVPVTIKNGGGSDVGAFDLTIYLDGDKAAVKHVDGIGAGATVTINVPLYTTAGKHRLKIVADEGSTIKDSNRANNAAEGEYVFP
ncbi:MAG TPA: CARDB domain-containing protein, partial [Methanoculleus sp.]|uniref:CARDB domain-containing protein n=1 Tax=Methanoculleus sp. TaxID=90427 RepID=UPI002B8CAFBF|nr:CARDB domain-containing protein [Methanoculleus sp.]